VTVDSNYRGWIDVNVTSFVAEWMQTSASDDYNNYQQLLLRVSSAAQPGKVASWQKDEGELPPTYIFGLSENCREIVLLSENFRPFGAKTPSGFLIVLKAQLKFLAYVIMSYSWFYDILGNCSE